MPIIRRKPVKQRTGLSDTTIWRLERAGQFPRRKQLSPGCVGWDLDEIQEWERDPQAWAKSRDSVGAAA